MWIVINAHSAGSTYFWAPWISIGITVVLGLISFYIDLFIWVDIVGLIVLGVVHGIILGIIIGIQKALETADKSQDSDGPIEYDLGLVPGFTITIPNESKKDS